jgi:hypothetical protein
MLRYSVNWLPVNKWFGACLIENLYDMEDELVDPPGASQRLATTTPAIPLKILPLVFSPHQEWAIRAWHAVGRKSPSAIQHP